MTSTAEFVGRYARPPSSTTVQQAVSTHEAVRALLGDIAYLTFLQGSYKNDTALWDMNDVDIVVVARTIVSSRFSGIVSETSVSWEEIFGRIERALDSDSRYRGKWRRNDKCIRLNTDIKIDIVPAVYIGKVETDPIAIYSFRTRTEKRNWPRQHYDAGAAKSLRTNGAFKQSVRLFKRWARCCFGGEPVAPSYYLECAVHFQPDSSFSGRPDRDFFEIGSRILQLSHSTTTLPRLAGEGNLFTPEEWDVGRFQQFKFQLQHSLQHAARALGTMAEQRGIELWTAVFNGQVPR
jgi:hypothetical protein